MSPESAVHRYAHIPAPGNAHRPLIMAHYMPWYASRAISGQWGWHWTMNRFDPDTSDAFGRPSLASPYRPLIGPYDSSDPDLLACHALQMKWAGIDGVFIDWYGTYDLYDYRTLHRNVQRIIKAFSKAGLRFCIIMEDQVVPKLVHARVCTPHGYAMDALRWLQGTWFNLPGYVRWQGKPLLLLFGPQFYDDADLTRYFDRRVALVTLSRRRGPAVGAFGWPAPQLGDAASWSDLRSFYAREAGSTASVAIVYPRFDDIYAQANVGPSYGRIADGDGETWRRTLAFADASGLPILQVASWNDWGEGTQIEPSEEYGYRDLEWLQAYRRTVDPLFPFKPADLRLPAQLYRRRKVANGDLNPHTTFDPLHRPSDKPSGDASSHTPSTQDFHA